MLIRLLRFGCSIVQIECHSCNATGVHVGTTSEDHLPCYLITLSSYLVDYGLRLASYISYGLVYAVYAYREYYCVYSFLQVMGPDHCN